MSFSHQFRYLLSFVLFSLPAQFAFAQINVDSIQVPQSIRSQPQSAKDQYQIETAIEVAAAAAKKDNKNVTVFLSSGKLSRKSTPNTDASATSSNYSFINRIYRLRRPITVPAGVVLAGEGAGRRSARMVWEECESNSALLIFRNGYGGGLRNIDIRCAPQKSVKNLSAIYLHTQSSAIFENFAIDLTTLGEDSNGLVINRNNTSTESVIFRDFDIRAARPVIIMSGDNLTFSNFDCGCVAPVSKGSISAIFQNWNGSVPDNWTIGPGTGQKGDHAMSFTGSSNRTGDALTVIGYRWEQGTSQGPAWLFDIKRFDKKGVNRVHTIESLTLINCRHAPQKKKGYVAIKVGNHSTISTNLIGGYLPGKKLMDATDLE